MRKFSDSVLIIAPSAKQLLCPILTDKNTARRAAERFTESRKMRAEKAPSGQLGVRKRPVYKGFFEPNRGLKGKYTKTLDFGFLTVHTKNERKIYLWKTN